ncbi:MAG: type II toxin-antitoxin system RelE/ParE family toxin [Marinibacterium sp.]|nr:type II toxin-antitoxin system RelE/ParE family toxin [Marinibacterium sp.]
MSRSFRLTRRAQDSLTDIARWTIDRFGPRQAEIYEAELLDRCRAIVAGTAHSRSCAALVDGESDLRYVRAGEHFLVFLDRPDAVIVVDVLHARSDLPRHLAALSALTGLEGQGG